MSSRGSIPSDSGDSGGYGERAAGYGDGSDGYGDGTGYDGLSSRDDDGRSGRGPFPAYPDTPSQGYLATPSRGHAGPPAGYGVPGGAGDRPGTPQGPGRAGRHSGPIPVDGSGRTPVPGGSGQSVDPGTGQIPLGPGSRPTPLAPQSGAIPLGTTSGPIRVERLQADRLVSDRPRVEAELPESFPDAVRIAAQGSGVSLSGDRPATRHRTRKGSRPGGRPPRADRVLSAYLSVILLAVVGLVGGGAWLFLGPLHKGGAGSSQAATGDRALLVGLTDGSTLVSAAALGTGGGGASCVLVPPSLLVSRGGRQIPLSDTVAAGPAAAVAALSGALNVRLDAGWLISLRGLTSLVDGGGGVVVDVDQEIRSGTVLVAAGTGQRLTGAQATAFVTVKREGEDAQAVQQRFATVLGQVLAGLPQDGKATATVGELTKAGVTSSLSLTDLAKVLVRIGAAVSDAGQLAVSQLPVVAAGADRPGVVVADRAVAGDLVRQRLGVTSGASATSG